MVITRKTFIDETVREVEKILKENLRSQSICIVIKMDSDSVPSINYEVTSRFPEIGGL